MRIGLLSGLTANDCNEKKIIDWLKKNNGLFYFICFYHWN
jgi:hypothetical protein